MQTISFYLYSNRVDAYTNVSADWLTERYRRVYNHNLKLHRGVDNKVDIQVKNSDQKSANIGSASVVFSLVGKETEELIIKKDCTIVDSKIGRISIIFSRNELIDLEPGFYKFSLYTETRTDNGDGTYTVNTRRPLYVDSQYEVDATVEIFGDVSGEPIDSFKIVEFAERGTFDEEKFFYSSLINANPEITVPQSWHTFQFKMSNYTGSITIEASQETSSAPKEWFPVSSEIFIDELNSYYENIEGKYNWLRVKHIPAKASKLAKFTIAQTIFGTYEVSIGSPGLGYTTGDTILIKGNKLGGETSSNDLVITVKSVGNRGVIADISWEGVSYNGVRTFVLSGETPNIGSLDEILYR
jgi:hypothetical protein